TRQLLAFARKQTMRPTVLDLNATIENLLTMMRRLIGENIELEWKPKAGLWPVHMDPSQIDQILTNLCVNARDAISTAGRISVLTENVSLDAAACAGRHDASAGDYVVISVTDTGSGISEAVRQHIFEPFFTTKEIGKGTGLGLATIYGIVTQNKGFIDVDSAPGRETTFRIHIPRHNVPAPPEQEDTKAKGPVRGHGKILLVEDDPGLLQICTLMLERVGYTVLPASAPTMALNLAHNSAINLDALVTDVIMPEGNGVELARKIRAIRPGLKCLFMSGYANDVVSREQIPKDTEFIQKPFSTAALAEKLGRMLNSANVSP
ncbi:MAG: response regulator, partial [Lentisphaerae bacterium]|nr:response regulator [Lentisphaerota bacterium]